MNSNTFADAVELAYAECWRQGDVLGRIRKGEIKFAGGEEGQNQAYHATANEIHGAHQVLGALLVVTGDVGRWGKPDDPEHFKPCIYQVWIRLMQWGIRKGLFSQAELDDMLSRYPRYAEAMENLGKDVKARDFRTPVAEGGKAATS